MTFFIAHVKIRTTGSHLYVDERGEYVSKHLISLTFIRHPQCDIHELSELTLLVDDDWMLHVDSEQKGMRHDFK